MFENRRDQMKTTSMLTNIQRALILALSSSLLFCFEGMTQNSPKQDSLLKVYQTQEGLERAKTLQGLFDAFKYSDEIQAEVFAKEGLELAESLKDSVLWSGSLYQMGTINKIRDQLDTSLYYFRKAIDISSKCGDEWVYNSGHLGLSDVYRLLGDYDEAIEALTIPLEKSRASEDYLTQSNVLNFMSSIYRNKGNYTIAYMKAIESIKLLEALPNQEILIADAYKSIGEIEFHRDNFEAAVLYYKKALTTYKEKEDWQFYGMTLNRIANSLVSNLNYEEAMDYTLQAAKMAKEKKFDSIYNMSQYYLGAIRLKTGDYEKAEEILSKCLTISRSSKNINRIHTTLLLLGDCATELNEFDKAEKIYNEGLLIADTIKAPRETQEFIYQRAQLYAKKGQYKKAFQDQRVFGEIKDSLEEVNSAQIIEELRIVYETEKKEQKISLQQKDIELLKAKEEISKNRQILIVFGSVILLLLAASLIYALIQKQRQDKILKDKLDASIAFKEKELTSHALHLAHKNEVLIGLKNQISLIVKEGDPHINYQRILNNIDMEFNNDDSWGQFISYFEEVHKDFSAKALKDFPTLTPNDLKLMALLKMNLSSKEIANMLNISLEGIKKARYRLRKKLKLNTEDSLQQVLLEY